MGDIYTPKHLNMCRIIALVIIAFAVANASSFDDYMPETESPEEFDESFDQDFDDRTKEAESLEKATAKENAAKASHKSSEAAAKTASNGHASSKKHEAS